MCEPVLMEIGRTIEAIERRTELENRIADKKNLMGDKELDIRVIPDKKKQQVPWLYLGANLTHNLW